MKKNKVQKEKDKQPQPNVREIEVKEHLNATGALGEVQGICRDCACV